MLCLVPIWRLACERDQFLHAVHAAEHCLHCLDNFRTGAGGAMSVPEATFPGGALIGGAGGFVNMAMLQGTHLAMKTGILAADAAFAELQLQPVSNNLHMQAYHRSLRNSWVMQELKQVKVLFGLVTLCSMTWT
jgi:flavin-dependent dehydrogenase